MVVQQLVEPVVASGESFALGVVGRVGQGVGSADHVFMSGEQFVQRALGFFEEAWARREDRLLRQ